MQIIYPSYLEHKACSACRLTGGLIPPFHYDRDSLMDAAATGTSNPLSLRTRKGPSRHVLPMGGLFGVLVPTTDAL